VTAAPVDHVALIGLMASGKTSVGRIVAARLRWPFIDSDEVVERRTGMTVAELWRHGGADAHRPHELAVVTETLSHEGPDVLAVPAGAIDDEDASAALGRPDVFIVWLRAEIDTLVARVEPGDHRPLLDDDPRAVLTQQARARSDRYEVLADLVLDVEGCSAEDLAEAVVRALPAARRDA
jgi:shikimate kinase